MSRFGIFVENFVVKVTNEVREFEKLTKIPCQMWFKIGKGKYCYEWVDVLLSQDKVALADGISKGDKIAVWGSMQMTEYNDKKSWNIWATDIEKQHKTETTQEDVPF